MNASAVVSGLLCAVAVGAALPHGVQLDRPTAPGRNTGARSGGRSPAQRTPTVRIAMAVGVGLGVLTMFGIVFGSVLGPPAAVVAWRLAGRLEPRAERRRRDELAGAVPHVVDLLAATLAAGLAPSAAVDHIADAIDAPMRDELVALSARLRLSRDPAATWRELAAHEQLAPVGRCVHRAVRSGASVSEAMSRLADDLRRNDRSEVEQRVRSVGVHAAVPLGLCLLPAFVLVGVVPLVAGSLPVVLGR
jgi:Flp pilus assembly protein TadB